jgi:hypothetical protein
MLSNKGKKTSRPWCFCPTILQIIINETGFVARWIRFGKPLPMKMIGNLAKN